MRVAEDGDQLAELLFYSLQLAVSAAASPETSLRMRGRSGGHWGGGAGVQGTRVGDVGASPPRLAVGPVGSGSW